MDQVTHVILQIEKLKAEGKFCDAISLLEDNIVKYFNDYRLFEELSDIYLFQWELEKALKSVNFAIELNKNSATGNYLKGFILLSQDKLEDAIVFLEKSNLINWNNAEVLRNLGWAYTMDGQYERWIIILKRALTISPGDELITEDLAMALIWSGNISDGNILLKKIWKSE